MESIISYLKDFYDFEIVHPSIPKNRFEYLKRNFYIYILRNVSERLFYFLRDKVYPIKFIEERYDSSIHVRNGNTEVIITPRKNGVEIRSFRVEIYSENGYSDSYINIFSDYKELFNKQLSKISEMKAIFRDKKMTLILKEN